MWQKSGFILILCLSLLNLKAAAQTVEQETFAVRGSKLAAIDLPTGARQIKATSVPDELKTTLAKLIEAGGNQVKQGGSEVIIWEGDFKKKSGSQMIKNLENTLKTSGWEYEIGVKDSDFVLFSVFRAAPTRRALVGFFVPSEEAFIFAVTEMVRADAPVAKTENQITPEINITTKNSKSAGDMNIYGKWFRTTGGGSIDYTGKTQYKSGEDFYFEFFPDGTVTYRYEKDVLSIMQCKINGTDTASGKYTINGDLMTINLGATSSVGTDSCSAKGNFNKKLPASTISKKFVIKKMESIFRPDNPTILCFEGQDGDACFEKVDR